MMCLNIICKEFKVVFFFQTANQVGVYILFVIPGTVTPVTHQQKNNTYAINILNM